MTTTWDIPPRVAHLLERAVERDSLPKSLRALSPVLIAFMFSVALVIVALRARGTDAVQAALSLSGVGGAAGAGAAVLRLRRETAVQRSQRTSHREVHGG